jgi:hypothetical protein
VRVQADIGVNGKEVWSGVKVNRVCREINREYEMLKNAQV